MVELGELEAHHADFAARQTRVVVASIEGQDLAQKTQQEFPHLLVLSDPQRHLIDAAATLHAGAGPSGEDVAAPTTFFIDRQGIARALFRTSQVLHRLSANDVLAAVDTQLNPNGKP